MSMRWRIFGAFSIIIFVTVLMSSIAAYYVALTEFEPFNDELNLSEQRFLSKRMAIEYSQLKDWRKTIDAMEGELLGNASFDQEFLRMGDDHLVLEFETIGELPIDQMGGDFGLDVVEWFLQRTVVLDARRSVVFDSSKSLQYGDQAYKTTKPMTVIKAGPDTDVLGYISITSDFSLRQFGAIGMLGSTLFTLLIGGALTMAVALLLAFWFANRITAPVNALTKATQDLANNHRADLLLIETDDELGVMTRAFNKMARSLKVQREVRTRLIHDISHELNTPLSIISLESNGMKDGMQSPEGAADQILHEVSMLKNLVNDLSWLVETDAEELSYKFHREAIAPLVNREVNRFRSAANAKGVSISVDIKGGDKVTSIRVRLDATRISQAIGNVLTNSIEHIKTGYIKVVISQGDKGMVVLAVTDTGKGISADHLPHVEDRFYRVDKSRSRDSGNRGLGLAITRSIIKAHGGRFSIQSRGAGLGTTVLLELPISL